MLRRRDLFAATRGLIGSDITNAPIQAPRIL